MSLRRNPISKSSRVRLGITIGDPVGIGPEVIVKALKDPSLNLEADFFIIGDKWILDKYDIQNSLSSRISCRIVDLGNVNRRNFVFGKSKTDHGRASIEYLEQAIKMVYAAKLDCLVTGPISKQAINSAGFKWKGHSEYLAHSSRTKDFVMMLNNKYLRTSLVTTHLPLKDVARELSKDKIYRTIAITRKALKEWFGIRRPRIVVSGLNPHASDAGVIGCEENDKIIPAVAKARKNDRLIQGPLPADTAISKTIQGYFDCVICMYHDQALIPLKITEQKTGVNITLGLPFIRTSPLHGTAFDIAGQDRADPSSMKQAIRLALFCAKNKISKYLSKTPNHGKK